jgi:hypothetical protein
MQFSINILTTFILKKCVRVPHSRNPKPRTEFVDKENHFLILVELYLINGDENLDTTVVQAIQGQKLHLVGTSFPSVPDTEGRKTNKRERKQCGTNYFNMSSFSVLLINRPLEWIPAIN